MAIARARVYHSVPFDVRNLVTSSVATLRSQGPPDDQVVETFERRFAEHVGAAHCVSFAFARTAVHQALESQALSHGSEVLMPPITISPMMDAVLSLGLRPVFVDIDPNSLIFDVEAFERAITPNTRAALITYLFGIAADPTPLIEVAARAGLFVIEDFSHNLGASVGGRSLGTFGDVGVYSCSATKTLDAYGGGLAVTNSTSLAGLLRTAQRRLPHPPARRVPPKVLVDLAWNAGSHKSMWSAVAFPLIRALRRWAPGVEDAISGANTPGAGTGELAPEAFERLSAHQARVGLAVLPSVEPGNEQRRRDAEGLRGGMGSGRTDRPRREVGLGDGKHCPAPDAAQATDGQRWDGRTGEVAVDRGPFVVIGVGVARAKRQVSRKGADGRSVTGQHRRVGRREWCRRVGGESVRHPPAVAVEGGPRRGRSAGTRASPGDARRQSLWARSRSPR